MKSDWNWKKNKQFGRISTVRENFDFHMQMWFAMRLKLNNSKYNQVDVINDQLGEYPVTWSKAKLVEN